MKLTALLILAFSTLSLGAQTISIQAGATIGGGAVMSSCTPAPCPRAPMYGASRVTGYGIVAGGCVGRPRPVYRPCTRVVTSRPVVYRPHRYRRGAVCMTPVNRCGDRGFYYGYRHCR
jgi:hypothetical protein